MSSYHSSVVKVLLDFRGLDSNRLFAVCQGPISSGFTRQNCRCISCLTGSTPAASALAFDLNGQRPCSLVIGLPFYRPNRPHLTEGLLLYRSHLPLSRVLVDLILINFLDRAPVGKLPFGLFGFSMICCLFQRDLVVTFLLATG